MLQCQKPMNILTLKNSENKINQVNYTKATILGLLIVSIIAISGCTNQIQTSTSKMSLEALTKNAAINIGGVYPTLRDYDSFDANTRQQFQQYKIKNVSSLTWTINHTLLSFGITEAFSNSAAEGIFNGTSNRYDGYNIKLINGEKVRNYVVPNVNAFGYVWIKDNYVFSIDQSTYDPNNPNAPNSPNYADTVASNVIGSYKS